MGSISVPALEIQQGPNRKIYSFAIDGKRIPDFASVTRVKRNSSAELLGYQRPEILGHISEIRKYLESTDPILPNSIVIAFDNKVEFRPAKKSNGELVRSGALIIPISVGENSAGPVGWVVDGQQRLAAIGQADIESFPVVVNAFIAGDVEEQRSQFILVNSTKPLPQGLIYELLPLTQGLLPTKWADKQKAAAIMQRLNLDEDSPFKNIIRTPTNPNGVIQDNSILRMVNHSLKDGILYYSQAIDDEELAERETIKILKSYWAAVKSVFPSAWGKLPRKSRLMHGVGIVSLGCLMDTMAAKHDDFEALEEEYFSKELQTVASKCNWESGQWDFGNGVVRSWNELQNTNKDTQLLSNYLLKEYRLARAAGGW